MLQRPASKLIHAPGPASNCGALHSSISITWTPYVQRPSGKQRAGETTQTAYYRTAPVFSSRKNSTGGPKSRFLSSHVLEGVFTAPRKTKTGRPSEIGRPVTCTSSVICFFTCLSAVTTTQQAQSAKSKKADRCRFREDLRHSIHRQLVRSRFACPGPPNPLVNPVTVALGNITV